ncbi:hypothetical protein [Micromonospora sp. HM5-17]|jgi:hypothetical protein|uniref:hypothetical protein n=1 Tax=Micromonospora sp. HM5-17 TaxID=2487710 RepID=UPI000F48107A|nr:hypothetical protein [Micromonospora sp. HM5-17]ROT33945.1 hypothetical protein EF879_03375 [Micromonospora sp. HM5-17]
MFWAPATVINLLVYGLVFAGLGGYALIRAVPAYLESQDGAILFVIIVGVAFLAIAVAAFWRAGRARRAGAGWFDEA